MTLYAKWNPIEYTITYNSNGGTGGPGPQTKKHGIDTTLSTTIPTRSGYRFDGWSLTTTGGVKYKQGATYTENKSITLYAVWTPNTYKITYNPNGGTGGPGSQNKTHGIPLTISGVKPTRANYSFQGWATSANGNVQYQPGGTFTANANTTLYAVWKPSPITFGFRIHGYGNTIHGSPISWPNYIRSESPHRSYDITNPVDLTGYTSMTFNIGHFHSSGDIEYNNKEGAQARIYIDNTMVFKAVTHTGESSPTTYSNTIDISNWKGSHTITYCYYNMDGNCEANDCSLILK